MIKIDWDIIEKKLDGSISIEEEQKLNAWCSDRKKNREYFEQVEKFYMENGFVKEISEGQIEQSWDNFKNRRDSKHRRHTIRRICIYLSGIASVLVIGFLVFFLSQEQLKDPVTSPIPAGTTKARLLLSGGEAIDLEHQAIRIQESTAEIINTGTSLSYRSISDTILSKLTYNQVETPSGGEFTVTLSDGTKLFLGPESYVRFPVIFGEEERIVEVRGEVFLDVVKNTSRPFIVQMENLWVKVLGTSFNVRNYADEFIVETTLISGQVEVLINDTICLLTPGYQIVLDKRDHKIISQKVEVEEFTAWKEGKIVVRNQRLEDILNRLSKWYGIDIFFANEEVKEIRFYANINRYANLNTLLTTFEKTGQVKFIVNGNTVYVEK